MTSTHHKVLFRFPLEYLDLLPCFECNTFIYMSDHKLVKGGGSVSHVLNIQKILQRKSDNPTPAPRTFGKFPNSQDIPKSSDTILSPKKV